MEPYNIIRPLGKIAELKEAQLNISTVKISIPAGANLILGQAHFIKTVEDLYEIVVGIAPHMKFGIAFNEASGSRLIRIESNDEDLRLSAVQNVSAIGAGHCFIVLVSNGYPINILNGIKSCPEVVRIFCATANPVEVVIAETEQGRGILGVIDGHSPLGIEKESDIKWRHDLLRNIGYKR